MLWRKPFSYGKQDSIPMYMMASAILFYFGIRSQPQALKRCGQMTALGATVWVAVHIERSANCADGISKISIATAPSLVILASLCADITSCR